MKRLNKGFMIDTIIVSGGNIQKDFALDFLKNQIRKIDNAIPVLIAADKGVEFFMDTEYAPAIAVGDFDSLSEKGRKYLRAHKETEIISLKPEKDDSDTQSAMNLAIDRRARNILLLGATGTRMDHFMANLGLLSLGKKRGAKVAIVDANNYISLIPSGSVIKKEGQFGKYVSFFPVGGEVEGLTLVGFKYPLSRYHLKPEDSGLTVSNELIGDEAAVFYESGTLMMIMSRD